MIHFQGDEEQLSRLNSRLEGWSIALAEINYLKTGYASEGLLDAHIITDDDIARKTSYAVRINAVTDPAAPLAVAGKKRSRCPPRARQEVRFFAPTLQVAATVHRLASLSTPGFSETGDIAPFRADRKRHYNRCVGPIHKPNPSEQ